MATFGELLTELRIDRKLSQKQLGEIIFVSSGTISNYENNIHYPDVEKLICLADYFDVTIDYLLGRSTSALSPKVLEEELLAGQTVGKVIETIQGLTPDQKRALSVLLRDMRLAAMISQYGEVRI